MPAGVCLEIRNRSIGPFHPCNDAVDVRTADVGRCQLPAAHRTDFLDRGEDGGGTVAIDSVRRITHPGPRVTLQPGGGRLGATAMVSTRPLHPPARIARQVRAIAAK